LTLKPLSKANRYRAGRAREYVRLHAVDVRSGDERGAKRAIREDLSAVLVDFLSDLLHLCDVERLDFAELERFARAQYREELDD